MNKTGLFFLVLATAVSGNFGLTAGAEETNRQLLRNPGFEKGTHKQRGLGAVVPKHWSRNWSQQGTVELVTDEKLAHNGKASVRLSNSSLYQGRFKVTPGMRYRIRAWMKAEGTATQTIAVYQYAWEETDGKREIKNMKSWGFTRRASKVANEWTLVEQVYTAPTDGSVDEIAFGLHIGTPEGQSGSVLVDDVSVRTWDGRPMHVRVAMCPVFRERASVEQTLENRPDLKKTHRARLTEIYARAEKLQETAKAAETLPEREQCENDFEALLEEYNALRQEIDIEPENGKT